MNVFILNRIYLESSHYPLRKTREYTIGIYSSLDKTYEALQAYVVDDSYKLWEKKYTMGFIVRETKLNIKEVLDKLISLELQGLIREISKNHYVRAEKGPGRKI